MKCRILLWVLLPLLLISCGEQGPDSPTPQPLVDNPGNSIVIYEANPKVFAKTDVLKSITANLDRIQSLGVNVLWLMPVYEQGSKDAIGSPYCVRDYGKINPEFGTNSDLRTLVSSAHSKGMRVILDWVANHTSWDNQWIIDHPDWYTQENGKIISPKGMGWNDVADLNYGNKDMRAAMKSAMISWVKDYDVDGFRCDYTDGVPSDFWKDVIDELKTIKGDNLLMLGESSNPDYYKSGFDLLYAWSYAGRLPDLFAGSIKLGDLLSIYKNEMSSTPDGKDRMRYIINHDTASSDGSPLTLYKGERGAMAAFVLSAFLKGVPMIYSSQEVGYVSAINFFDYVIQNWNSRTDYQKEYAKLMSVYAQSAPYRGSAPTLYSTGEVASIRYQCSNGSWLLIFVNTTGQEQTVKVPMELAGKKVNEMISGMNRTLDVQEQFEAYEYKIYLYQK